MWGIKICSNVPGHMTMPIYGENFKNLLIRNQQADDLETWYTASGTRVLSIFSYDDPGLTVASFMTGSDLFLNASAWMKAYTALSANVFSSFFLIQHNLNTQVSHTGPVSLKTPHSLLLHILVVFRDSLQCVNAIFKIVFFHRLFVWSQERR